ncbi:MAG: glycogen debranching enzyme N-terminal domain-containing protein [Vicinamibacterales bacterium]
MDLTAEWLEADGLGGFASGTVGTLRTRRYHGLLLPALTPPTGRVMLVPGIDAWVEGAWGRTPLTSQRYVPGVVHPDITPALAGFERAPWPTWTFTLPNGGQVTAEVFVAPGSARTWLRWSARAIGPATLRVRPLLAARDYHSLQRENGAARLQTSARGARLEWPLYDGGAAAACVSNGTWRDDPAWFPAVPVRRGGSARTRRRRRPGQPRRTLVRPESVAGRGRIWHARRCRRHSR